MQRVAAVEAPEASLDFTEIISCQLIAANASDLSVANSARISVDDEHVDFESGDEALVRSLMKNKHGSPFEHNFFKFKVEAPIFAFREHHRHRIGHSYNEMSGRYTKLEPKFYVPQTARIQVGSSMSYVYVEQPYDSDMSVSMREQIQEAYAFAWDTYEGMLAQGIAKEQARVVLPVGIYSKMIWSCNARSLMAFLNLRNAPQAQKEIRVVAEQAEEALAYHMPVTYDAFVKNGRVSP